MRTRIVIALAVMALAASATFARAQQADQPYSFSIIDPPGATYAEAYGINAGGDVVGIFRDAAGSHGFLLTPSAFTIIDFPRAYYTDARGINADGDIVGAYRLPGETGPVFHGYVRTSAGDYRSIDIPGHNTLATGILPDGTIVGCYHDQDMMMTMHGFALDPDGTVRAIDVPGTMSFGATPDGRTIVGRLIDLSGATPQHYGFMFDGVTFTPFRYPASIFTQAWGINARGDVIGYYRDGATKTWHGFLMEGSALSTFDFPGAIESYALGINAGGDIVGSYWDGQKVRGFIASRTQQHRCGADACADK